MEEPEKTLDPRDLGIDAFEFSVRTSNVLQNAGIVTLGQMMKMTRKEILALPNAGKGTANEILHAQSTMLSYMKPIRTIGDALRVLNEHLAADPKLYTSTRFNGREVVVWRLVGECSIIDATIDEDEADAYAGGGSGSHEGDIP